MNLIQTRIQIRKPEAARPPILHRHGLAAFSCLVTSITVLDLERFVRGYDGIGNGVCTGLEALIFCLNS
jgi:hypothetical protein